MQCTARLETRSDHVPKILCRVLAEARDKPPALSSGSPCWFILPLAPRSRLPRQAAKPAGLTAAQRSKNVESFEVVWKTIRDKHFDPKLGGLDWQAVHDASRPKVEAATTMKDARAVISEAIERLHQTHFGIIPAELYEGLENPNDGPGEVGLDVRLIEGRAVVSAVAEGRPAHRAGVKTGWVVDKIDGKPVSQVLKTAEAAYANTGLVSGLSDVGRPFQTPRRGRVEDRG